MKEKDIETKSQAFKRGYNNGYIDAKKGRKKIPHDTRDGYCCACNYDITRFEGELKVIGRRVREEYKNGKLVSNCCASDFDPFGYEKEEGIWQEKCLNCGKLCEPLYLNNRTIKIIKILSQSNNKK